MKTPSDQLPGVTRACPKCGAGPYPNSEEAGRLYFGLCSRCFREWYQTTQSQKIEALVDTVRAFRDAEIRGWIEAEARRKTPTAETPAARTWAVCSECGGHKAGDDGACAECGTNAWAFGSAVAP